MAYDTSEWSELFVASAGASAALAGLVFVAVVFLLPRGVAGLAAGIRRRKEPHP